MRFYKIKDKEVSFIKSITSCAQAKNHKDTIVASVTTKLADYSNPRMTEWREKRLIKLAKEFPGADYEKLSKLAWGETRCLESGKTIGVADFGTHVHESIEKRLNSIKGNKDYDLQSDAYSSHSQQFIEYVIFNNIQIMLTEHAIGCEKLMLAATADFIGIMGNEICLWDFKIRGGKSKVRVRAYDKDCMQLAVTAYMLKRNTGLAYMPRIYTVPIDRESGETYVKSWTVKKQEKELARFLKFNEWWNLHNFGIGESDHD